MSKEFNILVCGSARVGKSTLVNAICGRPVASTSNSLSSHTDRIEKYLIQRNSYETHENENQYSITIYDTPGIESWTESHVRSYFTKLMQESKPLCMIYCASPGSYARLDQLQWLVDTCIQSNIYCALVCTNKYCGGAGRRVQVLRDFHSLLDRYHNLTKDIDGIKYYGDVALCTSVNSIVYEDVDLNVRKEVEGINQLIFGILTSLKGEKVAAWCYTIADNQNFWETMKTKLAEAYEFVGPIASDFMKEHGHDIAKALIPIIIAFIKRKL